MIYLNKNEFNKQYAACIDGTSKEHIKLETLQNYSIHDYGINDVTDLDSVKVFELTENLRTSLIDNSKEKIEAMVARGVQIKRIRVVSFPLTKYTLMEFFAYSILEEFGQEFFIVEASQMKDVDLATLRDFHIFDREKILLNDNLNPIGFSNGALFSENKEEILAYEKIADTLLKQAVPFKDFCKHYRLHYKS